VTSLYRQLPRVVAKRARRRTTGLPKIGDRCGPVKRAEEGVEREDTRQPEQYRAEDLARLLPARKIATMIELKAPGDRGGHGVAQAGGHWPIAQATRIGAVTPPSMSWPARGALSVVVPLGVVLPVWRPGGDGGGARQIVVRGRL
jgi:hypothetical protein